jgi:hypothetical protein
MEAPAWAISMMASLISRTVQASPDRVLWSPGAPWWGIRLLAADRGDPQAAKPRALLAVDGMAQIVASDHPGSVVPGASYPMPGLVAALVGLLPVLRFADGRVMGSWIPPHARCGRCVVLLDATILPWLGPVHETIGAGDEGPWSAPSQPDSWAAPTGLHPWLLPHGTAPATPTLPAFVALCGEPPEMAALPPETRISRLLAWWTRHRTAEVARLRFHDLSIPAWATEPLEPLVITWVNDPHPIARFRSWMDPMPLRPPTETPEEQAPTAATPVEPSSTSPSVSTPRIGSPPASAPTRRRPLL